MNYAEWKSKRSPDWATQPINPECEVMMGRNQFCGKATVAAYPAHGCGWMSLCERHARKHRPHCFEIEELIRNGEGFE